MKRANAGGEYRFFLTGNPQRDERTIFPLLAMEPALLLLSFSSPLVARYPQMGRGASKRLGDQRTSWEQNTDQQQ